MPSRLTGCHSERCRRVRLERRSHESLYRASSSRSRFSCDSGASSAPATLFCRARVAMSEYHVIGRGTHASFCSSVGISFACSTQGRRSWAAVRRKGAARATSAQ